MGRSPLGSSPQFTTAENDIKRSKVVVENGLKTFDKDAKGAIPTEIDCCELQKRGDSEQKSYRSR